MRSVGKLAGTVHLPTMRCQSRIGPNTLTPKVFWAILRQWNRRFPPPPLTGRGPYDPQHDRVWPRRSRRGPPEPLRGVQVAQPPPPRHRAAAAARPLGAGARRAARDPGRGPARQGRGQRAPWRRSKARRRPTSRSTWRRRARTSRWPAGPATSSSWAGSRRSSGCSSSRASSRARSRRRCLPTRGGRFSTMGSPRRSESSARGATPRARRSTRSSARCWRPWASRWAS